MWRCWLSVLLLALSGIGCKKEETRAAPEPPPVQAPALPDLDELEAELEPEEEPSTTQAPVGENPIVVEEGLAGTVDLDAEGLPAISEDGRRVATLERSVVAGSEQPRLALRIFSVDGGSLIDEVVILDPKAGNGAAEPAALQRALARANKRLSARQWRAMLVPDQLIPDGWIRCSGGSQSFEVAGVTVRYEEPSLRVSRGDETLLEREMTGWVARPKKPGCSARGYIAVAAIDLVAGALMVVVDHCGECGTRPIRSVIGFQ